MLHELYGIPIEYIEDTTNVNYNTPAWNKLLCERNVRTYRCNFDRAWIKCNIYMMINTPCGLHRDPVCGCCGAEAIRECGETSSHMFVCDTLLCDDCLHVLNMDGCNTPCRVHVKPGEPNGIPWYVKEYCSQIGCTLGLGADHCCFYRNGGCEPIRLWAWYSEKKAFISKKRPLLIKKNHKRMLSAVKKFVKENKRHV